MEQIKLSKGQQRALDDALDGKNLFITGPGGVGKSFLIEEIITQLSRQRYKSVAVTASTGIAAVNIGGMTIHSFLKTGLCQNIPELIERGISTEWKQIRHVMTTDTIIIDEVSMLRGDFITMIDWYLKEVTKNTQPFGGKQIIFIGDMCQLPPVIKDDSKIYYKYPFQSPAWENANLQIHILSKIFRQDNQDLIKYLHKVRFGLISEDVLEYFNQCVKRDLSEKNPVILFPTNNEADNVNTTNLKLLPGEEFQYKATYSGHPSWIEYLKKNCISVDLLKLKVGAPVMFIKNDMEGMFQNGTRGVVKFLNNNTIIVTNSDSNVDISMKIDKWEVKDNKDNILAQMNQFPVKLAWACSIHKSQGLTLDYVQCDLRRCFEVGQGYVALSRVRDINGLSISSPLKKSNFKVCPHVLRYYKQLYKDYKEKYSI